MQSKLSTRSPVVAYVSVADRTARTIARIAVRNTAQYGQSCLAAEMLVISPEDASKPTPERTKAWTDMLKSTYLMDGLDHKLGDQGELTTEINDQDLGDTLDALVRASKRHEENIENFGFQGLSHPTKQIFAETQALFEKPFRQVRPRMDKVAREWCVCGRHRRALACQHTLSAP